MGIFSTRRMLGISMPIATCAVAALAALDYASLVAGARDMLNTPPAPLMAEMPSRAAPVLLPPTVETPSPRPITARPANPVPDQYVPPVDPTCRLPAPARTDKVVLFGNNEGTKRADVMLSGENSDSTDYAEIVIEPGADKLYIVLVSYSSMLWRFSGDLDRVSMVAPTSIVREDNSGIGIGGSGVIGLPRDKVAFLDGAGCLSTFNDLGGVEEAKSRGSLFDLIGRQPEYKGASYRVSLVSIPSMQVSVEEEPSRPWDNPIIVPVDTETVISALPPMNWDILPGKAGLDQLEENGHIVPLDEGTVGGSYRIVKTFPRWPKAMTGGTWPTFLLPADVEAPQGQPGWACVISEETGKPIGERPSPMC